MTRGRWLFAVAVSFAGCDADSAAGDSNETDVFGDAMPGDFPAGNCAETAGEDCETGGQSGGSRETAATAGDPVDCVVDGCIGQGVCAAPWDAEAEMLGEFECRFSCVPLLADVSWCANDEACCDSDARCTDRGYCVFDDGVDPTGTDTDGDTNMDGDTDVGSSTDTDTDTDGSTGTDTDGTTSGGET